VRVLVTDSDNRSALAATRSLGRNGHHVVVAGERADGLAAASKFAKASFAYPPPAKDPESFVATIGRAVREHDIDMLLPMAEITTLLLTSHRSDLPSKCALPFANHGTVERANDKAEVLRLAQALGVPAPRTWIVESPAEADKPWDGGFPCVIKPGRSRVRSGNGWLSTRVTYAHDAAELARALRALRPELFPILVQERIEGPGVGLFACYDRGRPLAFFAHRRLREKPPSGGVSVLREAIPVDPLARTYGERLLEALQWHGVAMVEFKQCSRDGSLRIMEINGRFWGSLQLAIDAGVDFPTMLADLSAAKPVAPISSYRAGVRSRWLLGDLDALIMVMTRSRTRLNLPPGFPSRPRVLWDFLHFWRKDQTDEVLQPDDPYPFFREFRRWISRS
jgi:predicted ATP-grasp superfamily ATP-dependent carboligase